MTFTRTIAGPRSNAAYRPYENSGVLPARYGRKQTQTTGTAIGSSPGRLRTLLLRRSSPFFHNSGASPPREATAIFDPRLFLYFLHLIDYIPWPGNWPARADIVRTGMHPYALMEGAIATPARCIVRYNAPPNPRPINSGSKPK